MKPTPTPAARPSSAPASATSPSAWPWACFSSISAIFPSPISMATPPAAQPHPGHRPGPAAALGGGGQIGAVAPDGVAAGRHGRPHPGLGPDPRRHHGHRRHLPAHAALSVGVALAHGHADHRRGGRRHRPLRRFRRPGPMGHQEDAGLLHHQPGGLHVPGGGGRRHRRRPLPPGVPRLLQGPALFGRGHRHPGPGRGAQHLPHGQPAPPPARGLLALSDRRHLPERLSAAGRLFQQGPHPTGHLYPSREPLTKSSGSSAWRRPF